MPSEIEQYTSFQTLRYAQCWEDASVVLAALDPQPSHCCLSIASGGENTLALLSRSPRRVIAIDLSPAQIACLELKVTAFRQFTHPDLLFFLGARHQASPVPSPSEARLRLYRRCRGDLSLQTQQFWDGQQGAIAGGIYHWGKFERYLATFRRYILPLIQSPAVWEPLLAGLPEGDRAQIYQHQWDSPRWRLLLRLFFSHWSLGRFGTDPYFLSHSTQTLAQHLLRRIPHALITQDPAANPYLHWILWGQHRHVLPYALRPEHFETIRANLGRLEWHCTSLEDFLERPDTPRCDRFNLSNVFEYMSLGHYHHVLQRLCHHSQPQARWVYWNRLAPRACPPTLAGQIQPLTQIAQALYAQDQVFFYSRLVIEQRLEAG